MNCPACNGLMIKARATNFGSEYDYCRTCKKELSELGSQTMAVEYSSERHFRLSKACRVMTLGDGTKQKRHYSGDPDLSASRLQCECGEYSYRDEGDGFIPYKTREMPTREASTKRYLPGPSPCYTSMIQSVHYWDTSKQQTCNCGEEKIDAAAASSVASGLTGQVVNTSSGRFSGSTPNPQTIPRNSSQSGIAAAVGGRNKP